MSSFSSGLAMESSVFYMEKSAQAERTFISVLPEFHEQREISAGGVARRAISRECSAQYTDVWTADTLSQL